MELMTGCRNTSTDDGDRPSTISVTAEVFQEPIDTIPPPSSEEQDILHHPHKDLSVDEVVQQYSDISELRPLSESTLTRPSLMFITSLDSLNGDRHDADAMLQDISDADKRAGDAEEDDGDGQYEFLRHDGEYDAAPTKAHSTNKVRAATRYRDESSPPPAEEDDSESFDEIRDIVGSSFFKAVDAVAPKVEEEKEVDFVPDFASIRKNTLARRKNSLLSQSLPSLASQTGSASADISRQSFNSVTAFSSSVDTSAPEKIPPAKLLFQSLRDEVTTTFDENSASHLVLPSPFALTTV